MNLKQEKAKTEVIRFRESRANKKRFQTIVEKQGLTSSLVLSLFIKEIIQSGKIPFRLESGFTLEAEQAVLDSYKEVKERSKTKKITSSKSVIDALNE